MFAHGGGAGGGFGGGGRQQQQRRRPDVFTKDNKLVAKLGSPKFPDARSKYLWLVIFYDNDSHAAAEAKPKLEMLAEKMAGTYKVGAMDCYKNEREADFCDDLGVDLDDLPEYGFVVNGKLELFEDANRVPSAKSLHEFAMEHMPKSLIVNVNHVKQAADRLLDPVESSQKKRRGHVGAVLLLTDKYETSALYYSLAYKYRSAFLFGESRAKNLNLAKEFGLKKYPLLLAFVPKGTGGRGSSSLSFSDKFDAVRYSGELKSESISIWLDGVEKMCQKGSGGAAKEEL